VLRDHARDVRERCTAADVTGSLESVGARHRVWRSREGLLVIPALLLREGLGGDGHEVVAVTLGDDEITMLPLYKRARRGISYLPQEPSVFRKLTVEQNLLAVLETLPLNEEERQARLQSLLDELGIARLAKSKAGVLSGGERRKVEITRALVLDPSFLCLDEPFAGIDPITVIEIERIIKYLKQRGIGVLMSEHNVHETLSIIDRAYVIHDGKILVEGTPNEIVDSAVVREVFLGEKFQLASRRD